VKFEDGTVADIPARDMEMQGDDNKKIGENELEDIVKEARYRPTPVSPGSRYPTKAKKTKNTNVHPGIPGMSKKGKEFLMKYANGLDTTGGPHLNHDNIHNFTHHGVNQTLKATHKHLEDNPHPEDSIQLALIKKELQVESVEMDESILMFVPSFLKHLLKKKGVKKESVELDEFTVPGYDQDRALKANMPKWRKDADVKTRKQGNAAMKAKLGKQHGIKSDPAYKKAKTKKQIKQARDQWNLKNPNDLWVGESVMKEAKKVRVKTQSGTTERVSPDDLKAAGDVVDRIKLLKLAIADKQHAAHQKKVDRSRIRQ